MLPKQSASSRSHPIMIRQSLAPCVDSSSRLLHLRSFYANRRSPVSRFRDTSYSPHLLRQAARDSVQIGVDAVSDSPIGSRA